MPERATDPRGTLSPAQFAEQFRESSRVLWCVAAGVLGDRSHADDVLQEAALTALTKLATFRPGTSFVAWMSQTVRFVALNHRRKRQRRDRALQSEGRDPTIADRVPPPDRPQDFDANVRRALASLGETQRTCLLLKTVVELEYSEIAEVLQIPAGTAMSHVSRARGKMAGLLASSQSAPTTRRAQ